MKHVLLSKASNYNSFQVSQCYLNFTRAPHTSWIFWIAIMYKAPSNQIFQTYFGNDKKRSPHNHHLVTKNHTYNLKPDFCFRIELGPGANMGWPCRAYLSIFINGRYGTIVKKTLKIPVAPVYSIVSWSRSNHICTRAERYVSGKK